MIDPEIGFTADVIQDPSRFVGRTDLIRSCVSAIASPTGLISVFGKRGVGKSSLLRQLQQMALGEYTLVKRAGLAHIIPAKPRTYLTVYYTCDSLIANGKDLLSRLCNDQSAEDSLLRLVPDDGKEITEFVRSKELSAGADLKVVNWGTKGVESSKYAKVVPNDIVQTFRNFVDSIVVHQVKKRMKRDGLLIILDEFDVIENKEGINSLIKSLTTPQSLFSDEIGRIVLKASRQVAEELDVQFIDQLIPRLVEKRYGPVLERVPERQGTYEFVNPVLRQYIRLRKL